MSAAIPARIRDVLVARLQTIRQIAGFNTDLGLAVYRGRGAYALQDLATGPAVNLYATGEEFHAAMGNQQRLALNITVEAFSAFDPDADAVADELLADIKAAVLSAAQPTLTDATGPLGQRLEYVSSAVDLPNPGEQMVSVAVTLRVPYFERYGAPTLTA